MTLLDELVTKRARLADTVKLLDEVILDLNRYQQEGLEAAAFAAAWAAVLMTTDIVRSGLSATFRVAAAEFAAIDKGIENANKLLKLTGNRTVVTKSVLMNSIDPNFQGVTGFLKNVREARAFLKSAKLKAPKHVDLALNIAISMTEDTMLLLQAGQLQSQIAGRSNRSGMQVALQLSRLRQNLRRVDEQITSYVGRAEILIRTA